MCDYSGVRFGGTHLPIPVTFPDDKYSTPLQASRSVSITSVICLWQDDTKLYRYRIVHLGEEHLSIFPLIKLYRLIATSLNVREDC